MKVAQALLALLLSNFSMAQEHQDSISMNVELEEVVFSVTRSNRSIYEVGSAVQIITAQEIRQNGTERLSDILSRQAGVNITYDHGTGVQLMGLASEYVMVLINGQPVVGRTAGVLDLDRISVSNVKRIEIVRGPASSLYGSEALAGVINIITEEESLETGMVEVQYRRFNTSNISGRYHHKGDRVKWLSFANYYGGSGFDLTPETYGKTAPAFHTATLENRLQSVRNQKHTWSWDNRMYVEQQFPAYQLQDGQLISGYNRVTDIGNTLTLKSKFSDKSHAHASIYHSYYQNTTRHEYDADGSEYYLDQFCLHFLRPEWMGEIQWTSKHISSYGTGATASFIQSNRYEGRQTMLNYFVFYQHEWKISQKTQVTAGVRYDGQSSFGQQVNPKLTLLYKPVDKWQLRIAAGSGFKAPDPRQLFLNFSNPLAGYSVFGALSLDDGLKALEAQGQLAQVLVLPESNTLNAERSYAVNIGQTWRPAKGLTLEADGYYNHVFNLIDTRVVARKANGQSVFSYYNVNTIFTTGLHLQASYRKKGWVAALAYEFMSTGDYDVLSDLKAGTVFRRNSATQRTERVSRSEYFGLFNRPKHVGSLQLMFTHPMNNWFVGGRMVIRGQFGFADMNGNQIPDTPEEMGPRYAMLYLSGGFQLLQGRLQLSAGIDNLSNFTSVAYLPGISGINPWIKARFLFHSKKS